MVACAHPTRADLKDSDGGGLWFSDDLTEADASRAWDALAGALCDQWNVIGVDLMSEPYAASWGKGLITDWDRAAARLGNKVLKGCSRCSSEGPRPPTVLASYLDSLGIFKKKILLRIKVFVYLDNRFWHFAFESKTCFFFDQKQNDRTCYRGKR